MSSANSRKLILFRRRGHLHWTEVQCSPGTRLCDTLAAAVHEILPPPPPDRGARRRPRPSRRRRRGARAVVGRPRPGAREDRARRVLGRSPARSRTSGWISRGFRARRSSSAPLKVSVPGTVQGTARTVRVSPALLPLLRGRVVLTKIAVDGLDLGLTLNAPEDAERSAAPPGSDWTQTLRALGSQTLDVELRRSRVVLSRPMGKSLTFEGIRLEATLRIAEGKLDVTLSRLSVESPKIVLAGSLRADAAGPSVELAARGSALDVTDVRGKLLSFLGDDPTVADIFGIVRSGTLTSFTFASSGKAPGDLGTLERMSIRAAVKDAKVRIPGPEPRSRRRERGRRARRRSPLRGERRGARREVARRRTGSVLVGLAQGRRPPARGSAGEGRPCRGPRDPRARDPRPVLPRGARARGGPRGERRRAGSRSETARARRRRACPCRRCGSPRTTGGSRGRSRCAVGDFSFDGNARRREPAFGKPRPLDVLRPRGARAARESSRSRSGVRRDQSCRWKISWKVFEPDRGRKLSREASGVFRGRSTSACGGSAGRSPVSTRPRSMPQAPSKKSSSTPPLLFRLSRSRRAALPLNSDVVRVTDVEARTMDASLRISGALKRLPAGRPDDRGDRGGRGRGRGDPVGMGAGVAPGGIPAGGADRGPRCPLLSRWRRRSLSGRRASSSRTGLA